MGGGSGAVCAFLGWRCPWAGSPPVKLVRGQCFQATSFSLSNPVTAFPSVVPATVQPVCITLSQSLSPWIERAREKDSSLRESQRFKARRSNGCGVGKTTGVRHKIIIVIPTDSHCHLPCPAGSLPQGCLHFHRTSLPPLSEKQSPVWAGFCSCSQVLLG